MKWADLLKGTTSISKKNEKDSLIFPLQKKDNKQ